MWKSHNCANLASLEGTRARWCNPNNPNCLRVEETRTRSHPFFTLFIYKNTTLSTATTVPLPSYLQDWLLSLEFLIVLRFRALSLGQRAIWGKLSSPHLVVFDFSRIFPISWTITGELSKAKRDFVSIKDKR